MLALTLVTWWGALSDMVDPISLLKKALPGAMALQARSDGYRQFHNESVLICMVHVILLEKVKCKKSV